MKRIIATIYQERVLFLVTFEHEDETYFALFYTSTGMSEIDFKCAGEIFPILGLKDIGKLGKELTRVMPKNKNKSGWIWKGCQAKSKKNKAKCRDRMESYFYQDILKEISLELEARRNNYYNREYTVFKFEEFIELVDDIYEACGTKFLSNLILEHYKKEALNI